MAGRLKVMMSAVLLAVMSVVIAAPAADAQSLDDFTITSYDVILKLGRDAEQRSTLTTTETITAQFKPQKNRGIERQFVTDYNDHPTSFQLKSVTDEQGNKLSYNQNGNRLRIGQEDVFVEGSKTYVITYTQRDVTRHYADTGKDEFYWDAIGVEWRVPIAQATIALELDESIAGAVETSLQCYRGAAGSSQNCSTTEAAEGQYTASAATLRPGEGVTLSLGFAEETFAEYAAPWWLTLAKGWVIVQVPASVIAIILCIVASIGAHRLATRRKEIGTIVPEYLPPPSASVTAAASLWQKYGMSYQAGSTMTAQLLDLAVRHYIRLYEVTPKSFFKAAEYEVEVIKPIADLRSEERELLDDMFGRVPAVGERLNLKTLRNNTMFYRRTSDNDKKLEALMSKDYGLYDKHNEQYKKRIRTWAKWLLIGAVVLLSPVFLLVAGIVFLLSFGSVLTDKGLQLSRYLQGLNMYIKVAEKDRIAMLQSPEGAEKVRAAVGDSSETQRIKLYEKVLPYAVLFGQEKEWSKQMGMYYERTGAQPDWYTGTGAFNAAAFATGMSGLSSATSTVSSSSSSTGGSSGGGSAGGGGGGGGGGGW